MKRWEKCKKNNPFLGYGFTADASNIRYELAADCGLYPA
jgi:hypothetical protein